MGPVEGPSACGKASWTPSISLRRFSPRCPPASSPDDDRTAPWAPAPGRDAAVVRSAATATWFSLPDPISFAAELGSAPRMPFTSTANDVVCLGADPRWSSWPRSSWRRRTPTPSPSDALFGDLQAACACRRDRLGAGGRAHRGHRRGAVIRPVIAGDDGGRGGALDRLYRVATQTRPGDALIQVGACRHRRHGPPRPRRPRSVCAPRPGVPPSASRRSPLRASLQFEDPGISVRGRFARACLGSARPPCRCTTRPKAGSPAPAGRWRHQPASAWRSWSRRARIALSPARLPAICRGPGRSTGSGLLASGSLLMHASMPPAPTP